MDYLLDTNILVVYSRANDIARQIENDLKLLSLENNLTVSAVSVGEIESIAIRNKWGARKITRLERLLDRFLIADINVTEIFKKYAEIDAYSQGKLPDTSVNFTSRNMGKNDLWIAATAAVLDFVLVTTDNDFNHLEGTYLTIRKVRLEDYVGR